MRKGRVFCLAAISMMMAGPALAELSKVTDRVQFVQLVTGKVLQRPFVALQVTADGGISGEGAARPVTGNWSWQNGLFCRDLTWGDRNLGYDCQEVRAKGDRIRFISGQNGSDAAEFRLR